MSAWHYSKDGQQQGPVSEADLRKLIGSGSLSPTTLVWKEGLAGWVAANTLPEFSGGPPVIPGGPPLLVGAVGADSADAEKNKVMGIIAYIGILFIVPLIAAKDSPFAKFHANQGLLLFLASIVISMAAHFTPFVGCFLWLVPLVFMVLGIVNAAKGECKPLPVIGGITLIK